jgi:transposase
MQTWKLYIGIDVSKLKLDVCLCAASNPKEKESIIVSNNFKGLAEILKAIDKKGFNYSEVLFCFEHTGVYSMPLCYFLQENKVSYSMVPAIEIKRSKGLTRGKTDKTDAKDIAVYAITHLHKIQCSQLPERSLMQLKVMMSEREKIVKAIGMFQKTSEKCDFLPKEVLKDTLRINKSTVLMLKKKLKAVDEAISKVANANEIISKQLDLARTIPGIGPQTALYLIIYSRCFQAFSSWRKFACYGGIAPFHYQSGSSIKGRTKVSPLANKKLKSLLNMAALTAKKYDPDLKNYYQRKVKEGKNPMLVMNAIRCKLVSRVFATVKRETPYVNTQKFAA